MKDPITGQKDTPHTAAQEAYSRTRDYFLGESLKPTDHIPDLLAENRKIALSLAESVMELVGVIADYFGIPTMELVMEALPECALELEADGIREKAAAKTYLDLRGTVPLAEICHGTHAYPVPALHCVAEEIQRRARFAAFSAHDPLLKRIFHGFNDDSGGTGKDQEDSEPKDSRPDKEL